MCHLFFLRFAMISGVPLGTLSAHVFAIHINGILELTTRTKIVRLNGKRTRAFLTVLAGACRCDTIISSSATIALRAYRMMFTRLKIMQTTRHEIKIKYIRITDTNQIYE